METNASALLWALPKQAFDYTHGKKHLWEVLPELPSQQTEPLYILAPFWSSIHGRNAIAQHQRSDPKTKPPSHARDSWFPVRPVCTWVIIVHGPIQRVCKVHSRLGRWNVHVSGRRQLRTPVFRIRSKIPRHTRTAQVRPPAACTRTSWTRIVYWIATNNLIWLADISLLDRN